MQSNENKKKKKKKTENLIYCFESPINVRINETTH